MSITGTDTPPVRVLTTSITVPSGKHGDVQASFSATLTHQVGTYAYCFGAFTLGGAPPDSKFKPGSYQLLGGATANEPDAVTVTMTGFRKGVGPGTHSVNVYITSSFAGCSLQERALNVLVNIH